jgi:hypothetical protein
MSSKIPDPTEFIELPSRHIAEIVYPRRLSISLLLNGTRRWYIAQHFDAPPADNHYFPHYLETVLIGTARLLEMLAEHGVHRVFLPVYSPAQTNRHPQAYAFLLKGISALATEPHLLEVYRRAGYMVRFYGNTTGLPDELRQMTEQPLYVSSGEPRHYLYYGVNTDNPHTHLFELAYQFGLEHGHPPSWEDMLELYYGDRTVRPIDVLIAFNRIYAREGLPPLLEGRDRIYSTVVTPLVLSPQVLRRILYDYLYNYQDPSRNYQDIHPNEVRRLRAFYNANQETVIGLMQKREDLVYPLFAEGQTVENQELPSPEHP